MSDALRLKASRSAGEFVEGWTDRPTVPPHLAPIWTSYVAWANRAGRYSLATVGEWIGCRHRHEDDESRALLFEVFVELAADRERFEEETAPKPEGPADG